MANRRDLFSQVNGKYADVRLPGVKDPVGVLTWSLPSFALSGDPKHGFKGAGKWRPGDIVCPMAFMCIRGCYARGGNFIRFKAIGAKQHNAFGQTLTPNFVKDCIEDIGWFLAHGVKPEKYPNRPLDFVRIHDSGEFYDEPYLLRWLDVVKHFQTAAPTLKFWAYTKCVQMMKRHYTPAQFPNLNVIYSEGGWQDDAIDKDQDRFSRVFARMDDLKREGFADGGSDDAGDLVACFGANRKVGLVYHQYEKNAYTTDDEAPEYLPSVRDSWDYVQTIKFIPPMAHANPMRRSR